MAGKHAKPVCEVCGTEDKQRNFVFVSYAVNPQTSKKGMLLCKKHEQEAVRGYEEGKQ